MFHRYVRFKWLKWNHHNFFPLQNPYSIIIHLYVNITHFNYCKLSDIKQQTFYYDHRFHGTEIWIEPSKDGFLCSTMFGASPGKTQMTLDWNYLEALHSHAWCLDCDGVKAEFSWDWWLACLSLSRGHPHSIAASGWLDFLGAAQDSKS